MEPKIDHIQITVQDLQSAEDFYDKLMPLLGFELINKSKGRVEEHDFDVVEYGHPNLCIGINSPREQFSETPVHRRRPGALHHLAFRARSREEIDNLFPKVKATGAEIVDPPKFYPQHGESYYALFFKDNQGIKYELVYEEREVSNI